jgi:DNA-binding MarR family transcriptional regulator
MGQQMRSAGIREPGVVAWLRLARIFRKVERLPALGMRDRGLTRAQFDVIAHVGAREGLTQHELADSLVVTKVNVCQLLDRMEGNGLIVRRQQGRSNCLFLTEEGKRLFVVVVPEQETLIGRAFAGLTRDEKKRLLELLRKLERQLPSVP